MSDEIAPALTPEEWANERMHDPTRPGSSAAVFLDRGPTGIVHFVVRSHDTWRGEPYTGAWRLSPRRAAGFMALANAARPDDDPGKITWAMVDRLRRAADVIADRYRFDGEVRRVGVHSEMPAQLRRDADALASLLLPRDS